MLSWIIQISLISIIFIFLIHHLIGFFKSTLTVPKIIDLVNNSKMRNGEPYAENTKKSAFQSILFVIDNLKLNIDKKPYLEQFEIKKIISME